MPDDVHAKNPLVLDDLYAAFEAADAVVLKKYIAKLSDAPCIELSEELKTIEIGENVSLYRVGKIVYDKNENTRDKLTTVYSTIFSLPNYGLVMAIRGHKDNVDLYLGVPFPEKRTEKRAKKRNDYLLFGVWAFRQRDVRSGSVGRQQEAPSPERNGV